MRDSHIHLLNPKDRCGPLLFMKQVMMILVGSVLIGLGVNIFLVPFELLDGGALGISLIIHYVKDVRVGLTLILVSIPIFTLAFFCYRSFFYKGIHGMLFSSLMIDMLSPFQVFAQKLELPVIGSAAIGGIIIGIGVGTMLRLDISIGGTDLLAQMVAKRLKINTGYMIFFNDILIVSIGSLILLSNSILLSYTTVFFVSATVTVITAIPSRKQKYMSQSIVFD